MKTRKTSKKQGLLFLLLLALAIGSLAAGGCQPAAAPPVSGTGSAGTGSAKTSESPTGTTAPGKAEDPYAGLWDRIDGSTATIPLTEGILADRLGISPEEAASRAVHSKTDMAYRNLIYGQADLIFVTAPSEEVLASAQEERVELEVIPVTKDALVFLVNAENPVDSLTQQQLVDIYTGQITNWEEAGGSDAAIKPFQRPLASGSQTLFLQLLMKDVEPTQATPDLEMASMGGLIDAVADYDNAASSLGYSVFYYATDMYLSNQVKLLEVDGVKPTKETIAAGEYPLGSYYYAVMRKDTAAGHPARRMVDWLLSSEGQAVAEKAGYVPLQ